MTPADHSGVHEVITAPEHYSTSSSPIPTCIYTQFFTNPILLDALFSFLALTDILSLSRVCRTTNAAAKSYTGRALNINRRLARFFPDPHAFRALQAHTSVTFAPGLPFDAVYRSTALVLHVHRPHVREVGDFFLSTGYALQRSGRQMAEFEQACAWLSRLGAHIKRLDEIPGSVYDTFIFTKSIMETAVVLTITLDIFRITKFVSGFSGI